jgi:hypothetical protein
VTVGLAGVGLVLGANAVLAVVAATPSGADTLTFTNTGFTPFQVPAGVTTLTVTLLGAGGEVTTGRGPSGAGGSLTATIPTAPCQTLQVLVGASAIASNGLPLGGGASAIEDVTETYTLLTAGGGGVGGQDGSISGVGGAGGAGGGGAPFAATPNPLGGPAQAGGNGAQGTIDGGFGGMGGGQNNGAGGNGVDGGQNGTSQASGAGANGGGHGGGGGAGFSLGGGGGGGGMPTEGGGGGGGGASYAESIATNVAFGTGAPGGANGSVTLSYSGATGSCTPTTTTTPTTTVAAAPPSGPASPLGQTLAFTGGPSLWVVDVGLFSVVGGGVLLGLGRRRSLRDRSRHAR